MLDVECLSLGEVASVPCGLVHPGGCKGQVIKVGGVIVEGYGRTIEILLLRRAGGQVRCRGVGCGTTGRHHLQPTRVLLSTETQANRL